MQPAPAHGEGHGGRLNGPWLGVELTDATGRRWTQLELQALVTSNEFLQASA